MELLTYTSLESARLLKLQEACVSGGMLGGLFFERLVLMNGNPVVSEQMVVPYEDNVILQLGRDELPDPHEKMTRLLITASKRPPFRSGNLVTANACQWL